MASEDVIELGSSDEEAVPPPKKKKPMPNAMVLIPRKHSGLTNIKSGKLAVSSTRRDVVLKKPIAINANLKIHPNNLKSKLISKIVNVPIQNKIVRNVSPLKASINPLSSIVQNLNNSQLTLKKVPPTTPVQKFIGRQDQKVLNKLPASITIKPVHNANTTIKPIQKPGASGVFKRLRVNGPKKKLPGEILTLEIEDEDTPEAKASPQWYLRPEDQSENAAQQQDSAYLSMEVDSVQPSMEEKNNKEPDKSKYVEITIEDSPLKPSDHLKHPDIGKELTITIEDSPVKPIAKPTKDVGSDIEINEMIEDKHSRKKLDYLKESKGIEMACCGNVVEIEIDLSESRSFVECEKNITRECEKNITPTSPKHKPNEKNEESLKQKIDTKTKQSTADIEKAHEIIVEDDEFHPTYQKFINMCFILENSDDMKRIVEKKIKAYYRQCPKEYVESEEFIDMVSSKTVAMKASPDKMYLYIKDIVDELNLQRKMKKSIVTKIETEKESSNVQYEESRYDSKKRRQIRKLEKTIKKLHRAIQKLEEQEVDFDDDEDSVYLLTERYKERMVRVHAKFCQLTNTKLPSEPRLHVEARPGRHTGPAKRLEKWINRKLPIGTPLPFPDFHDVIRCVQEANEEDKLGWTDIEVMEEARDLFTRCGKKLQRRRQENEWRLASSRISSEKDPAENSLDLKKKLDENKTVAAKRETELLNKYVDRQNLLKLEAEEIGDKEAEESPVESEEEADAVENDCTMDDKHKRKLRLKKFLHKKSKKDEDIEKENRIHTEDKENDNEKSEESNNISGSKTNKETLENNSNSDEIVAKSVPNETEATKEPESGSLKANENTDSDTYKVESDVDELHLLQKLHSENEANTSTLESSDSDSPIAISDTLESDSEQDCAKSCDIISIENSSYSESEMINDDSSKECDTNKQNVEDLLNANFKIEFSSAGIETINKETEKEKDLPADVDENILLASSDEEVKGRIDNTENDNTCINLGDDNISISETIVDGEPLEQENVSNNEDSMPENNNSPELIEDSPSVKENDEIVNMTPENIEYMENDNTCINLGDDNISISETTVDRETSEQGHMCNDANSMPNNNSPQEIIEKSPNVKKNDDTINLTEENIKDYNNSLETTIDKFSTIEEVNNDDNDSANIVDIRSASNNNLLESTDLQTNNDNNEYYSIDRMDFTESNCNDKSEVTKSEGNAQDKVHSIEKEINNQSTTTETSDGDVIMGI